MYQQLHEDITAAGRDPDQEARICTLLYQCAAATKMEAEDKFALIEKLPTDTDALSLLSEALNFDFATKNLDDPFTPEELAAISGVHTTRDRVIAETGRPDPTVREFMRHSGRARPHNAVVGGPKEVADRLEEMFLSRACDGFVVAATHIPGSYVDFVAHVIPELQRRGLYHTDYAGPTLRENLGLKRPVARGGRMI